MRFSTLAAIVACVLFAVGCKEGSKADGPVDGPVVQIGGSHQIGATAGAVSLHDSKDEKPATTETRKVDAFAKVAISSTVQADIKIGSPASVAIEASPDVMKRVSTTVSGGTLTVELTGSGNTYSGVKAHIVVPSLDSINADGASTFFATELASADFSVNISGASHGAIGGKLGALKAHLDGSSQLEAIGSATSCDLTVEAASKANLARFEVGDAKARCSGASLVDFGSTKQLDVVAEGASTIHYGGSPKIVRREADVSSSINEP